LDKTENAAKRSGIIRNIQNMLERSFNLTRSLSVELSPPVLHDHGLAAALEWLAVQARKHHGAKVSVDADSSANPKAIDVRVFLFQAVRELLLNAVKHASWQSRAHYDEGNRMGQTPRCRFRSRSGV
jgi:signal transduction histidine kinase